MSSMDTMMEEDDSFLSNTDAIIFGTSDHSGWAGDSMISDTNIVLSSTSTDEQYQQQISTAVGDGGDDSTIVSSGASSSWFMNNNKQSEIRIFNVDFRALSGVALRSTSKNKENKGSESNQRSCTISEFHGGSLEKIGGAVNEEGSDRLVVTLMACAEAVQQNNLNLADALVRDLGILAAQQSGVKKKVATYFAQALDRRIHEMNPQNNIVESDFLQMHFNNTCPYLRFAHLTANQAILEAFGSSNRVHVIDFSLKQGLQWPALMQDLARRADGPPVFRLTGIGPTQPDNTDALWEIGRKLAEFAEEIGLEFHFSGFKVHSLADIDASRMNIRPSNVEALAVNSVFALHHALSRPGAIDTLLNSIKEMQPNIVTITEQEADNNESIFLDRFKESWDYYSTMFDSMGNSGSAQPNSQDSEMADQYLGREIYNMVACEGSERVERHETLSQWRVRMNSAGFIPVQIHSKAYHQANILLFLYEYKHGYRVAKADGCLTLIWGNRPLITTSAWQLAPPSLG